MFCAAWISSGEMLLLVVVGLLLFGGRLPDVAKDIGRVFLRARRALEDIRRESGIDETLRDLERESREVKQITSAMPDPSLPKLDPLLPKADAQMPRIDSGKSRGESGEKPTDGQSAAESSDSADQP